jgi:predicted NAD/FAD-binding protein/DUF1365 family protein
MTRQRIAVIGAGIAGLSAAWLLRHDHDVTLYEADSRAGGHADTQTLTIDGQSRAVDTGFIVLNDRNYPNLSALFEAIGVPTEDTEMSFGVSVNAGSFEYGGGTIPQLFAQKSNLLRPRFWQMLRDIMRFYREAPARLALPDFAHEESLGEFLDKGRYSQTFIRDHILPMGAAIWSASLAQMRDFPVRSFVRFFQNHGLLSLNDRPQWHSVRGGSKVYVARILADIAATATVHLGCKVTTLRRDPAGVTIETARGAERFDAAILACHADQSLALLSDPSPAEQSLLGAVRCSDNLAILHGDASLMPRRRGVWSAWNYLAGADDDSARPVSLTYWMNRLQNLPAKPELFVTLNPPRMPNPALVHATRHYRHPQFNAAAIAAQRALPSIQGVDRLWFAGAWTAWGFHEDGIASAVAIAESLGVAAPWKRNAGLGALPPAGPGQSPGLTDPPLLLHTGRMAHIRHGPFTHRFGYSLWMLSADLDRLDTAGTRWFAHNRLGVLSLHDRDHGPRNGAPLAPWLRAELAHAGLAAFGANIRLLAIPRVFGWAFNPIAFYFCRDAEGRLGAVLHQVANTFGDQHCYLLPVDPPDPGGGKIRQHTPKRLHVSPFFDLRGGYRFSFRAPRFSPGGRFDLAIRYGAEETPRLTATMHLQTRALTANSVLGALIRQPLMPVKVLTAIHWQALRLWLRGARFHHAPAPPANPVSLGSTP